MELLGFGRGPQCDRAVSTAFLPPSPSSFTSLGPSALLPRRLCERPFLCSQFPGFAPRPKLAHTNPSRCLESKELSVCLHFCERSWDLYALPIYVFWGCCHKAPHTGQLERQSRVVTALETGSLRSRRQRGWLLLRALSLACRWSSLPCVFTWSFLCTCVSYLSSSRKDSSCRGPTPAPVTSSELKALFPNTDQPHHEDFIM